jgi:hypothetical protein
VRKSGFVLRGRVSHHELCEFVSEFLGVVFRPACAVVSPSATSFKSSMFMVPAADTAKPCFHPFCCAHLRVLLHQSFQARKALAILTLVEDHVVAHCPEVCGANTPQQHKPFPPGK